jgi:hypothetical protein
MTCHKVETIFKCFELFINVIFRPKEKGLTNKLSCSPLVLPFKVKDSRFLN